jgi:ATP/maltotriose-dependent transcriptional regulator MalT
LEEAGQHAAANVCVEVLHNLDATSAVARDRLAQLAFRSGNLDRAAEMLASWEALEPENPWPLMRRAIVEQERGQSTRRVEAIERALHRTQGPTHASVAYLGARLSLRQARRQEPDEHTETERAESLLREALKDDPGHVGAVSCLAALLAATGRFGELAELSGQMNRPGVADPRFQLLSAACHLASGDSVTALQTAQSIPGDNALATEAHFVAALAHHQRNEDDQASAALLGVIGRPQSFALDDSRARLGAISFGHADYDQAIEWWNALDPEKRQRLQLDQPLRALVFLAGVDALRKGSYRDAAGRLVEARRLGCEDPRLSALLPLALLKAGRQLLFEESDSEKHARLLDPSSNGTPHGAESGFGRMRSALS